MERLREACISVSGGGGRGKTDSRGQEGAKVGAEDSPRAPLGSGDLLPVEKQGRKYGNSANSSLLF